MTAHSTSFPTDQPLHPATAEALLPAAVAAPVSNIFRKLSFFAVTGCGATAGASASAAPAAASFWSIGKEVEWTVMALLRSGVNMET